MHVTVAPLGDRARSRVTIDVDFEGHGIGKLLVPLVRWLGRKDSPTNCRNLKERLEGRDEHASRCVHLDAIEPHAGATDWLRAPSDKHTASGNKERGLSGER